MELSDRTKVLILIAIIGIFIFFFLQNGNHDATQNEGALKQNLVDQKNISEEDVINNEVESEAEADAEVDGETEMEEETEESRPSQRSRRPRLAKETPGMNENILKKLRTRNSSRDGQFVYSSFVDGKRGGKASDLDQFFEDGHPLDKKVGFQRNEGSEDVQFANYVPGKSRKMRDVDKFNAEALLPKESNKDWWSDPYSSTSVKNTHLINIYRPIGVNTIQTTLKNPSHDIRGSPPNPKYAVSPWQNSSYEPDTNLRNQSLCY